ncbi:hypothetical protein B0H66DRAFT_213880 [Apodospora peruviana]|uniref:Uncharacterized protein n=1 Tax=Apodospora peruviana TaxID=516989 RepID=A0AAE0M815_9PEZI|nr:hypothetical protein B0H66DRAFT_213880 [Apodospora peruviana]
MTAKEGENRHTMTALGTIDLASELDCSSGRCVTRSRSYNFNTTMNINAPPPTPNCADRDSLTGYKVYWQIKAYGPLYYSALPPPPSDTAVMQSKEPADVVLFSMQYVGSSMQFPCTAAGPAAGAAAGAAAKLSSPAAIVIEGSCTGTMGLEGSIPFQYNPASKVLTLTSVSGCITVRGAGELAAMTCRSGDTSCQLDDLWIGGDIVF